MADNLALRLNKRCNRNSGLRVSKVNKGDDSWRLFVQVIFTEEAIVEADGCTFVDNSERLEASNFCGIEKGLALYIRGI